MIDRSGFAALALLAAAGGWVPGLAEETPRADVELLEEVRAIAGRVEKLREDEFATEPIAVRGSRESARRLRDLRVAATINAERLAARGRAWEDLGLGDERRPVRIFSTLAGDVEGVALDTDLRGLVVENDRLTLEDFEPAIAGEKKTALLLATGVRPDEPLVAHVLIHLLQLQRAGGDHLRETTDSLLASAALAEGEANLVAIQYLFQSMGLDRTILEFGLRPEEVLEGALVPREIAEHRLEIDPFLDFVYQEGLARVSDAFRQGGWSRVREVLRRTGATRDVLHPGRRPFRESPPSPPDLPIPEGYALRDHDVLGEQSVIVLISRLTGKDNLALIAGDGWAGDSLFRWEPEGDPAAGVTAWVTRWETDEAADDFEYAIGRAVSARFGHALEPAGGDVRTVSGNGRELFLERRGREMLLWISPAGLFPVEAEPGDPPSGS